MATAESYCSVTYADTYHSERGNTGWTGTEAVKESALRNATQHFDGAYGGQLPGRRASVDQALELPRVLAYDRDGFGLASDEVWPSVAQAIAELALDALGGGLAPNLDRGGQLIRSKLGPLEEEYAPGAPGGVVRPRISLLLSRIMKRPGTWIQEGF